MTILSASEKKKKHQLPDQRTPKKTPTNGPTSHSLRGIFANTTSSSTTWAPIRHEIKHAMPPSHSTLEMKRLENNMGHRKLPEKDTSGREPDRGLAVWGLERSTWGDTAWKWRSSPSENKRIKRI
jgi:hypothetical protein